MVAPLEARAPGRLPAPHFPARSATLFPYPPGPFRSKRRIAISRPPRAATPPLSPLSSLRRPNRRPNHLRPKLLKSLTPPPPHPVLEAPQTSVEKRGEGGGEGEASRALVEEDEPEELQPTFLPLYNGVDGNALIVEETETELLVSQQIGDQRSFFPTAADIPRLVLEISVYLVGLLAVQTVCAVFLLGGSGVGEGKKSELAANGTVGEVKKTGPEVGERELEFERTVSTIQAMAREARAAEAREAAGRDGIEGLRGDIVEEVNQRVGRLRKRMPGSHVNAKTLSNALVDGDGGKVRRTPAKGFNGRKSSAAPERDFSNGGSQQTGRDHRTKKPSQLHARKASSSHSRSVPEKETAGLSDSGASGTASKKYTEHNHQHEKAEDSQSTAANQLWWLNLPYVLAIFLHRGSNRKEFKGLYSLKLDSSSEEGSDSYTILFEDRIDATNFCYLLELFFEDLDDFFADIVPISVQEVHDAVKSRTLQVIVVRKGQLQLYAGQPLAEAEMQLRSILD